MIDVNRTLTLKLQIWMFEATYPTVLTQGLNKMVSYSEALRKLDQVSPSVLDINDVLLHLTLLIYQCFELK